MDNLALESLGLARKWPKLDRLQSELADLQKRLGAAEGQVRLLENQISGAREKDLEAAAAAIRKGEEAPHGTHEDAARRQLEAAERDRAILQKAVESVNAELGVFRQQNQSELYRDVARARAEIAARVAKAAQEALAGFGRWSDMHYVLKDLQPPPDTEDWTGPAARSSTAVIGVHTRAAQGPDRGHIEASLQYLMGLAGEGASPTATGDTNAA